MAKQNEHPFYDEKYELHSVAQSVDGGACFGRHQSLYKEDNSCSYRWQGVVKARERKTIYNIPQHPNWHLDNFSNPKSWKNVVFAKSTIDKMDSKLFTQIFDAAGNPMAGKGKGKNKLVVGTPNFTNGQAPYSNQVHHVIPLAILCDELTKVTTTVPDKQMTIFDLIIKGLMKEKYNINYKENMIILPCELSKAKKLGLPTHKGSHGDYDSKIKGRIQSSLRPYKRVALQLAKDKPHDKPDPKQLKEDLVKISQVMYQAIIDSGQQFKNKKGAFGINDLPNDAFTKLKAYNL
jgi:hypothetical protein